MLLNLCSTYGLCILNGACNGDLHGHCTHVTDSGYSAIVYFIVSEELFSILFSTLTLFVADSIESKHMPVELLFTVDMNRETIVILRKLMKFVFTE